MELDLKASKLRNLTNGKVLDTFTGKLHGSATSWRRLVVTAGGTRERTAWRLRSGRSCGEFLVRARPPS